MFRYPFAAIFRQSSSNCAARAQWQKPSRSCQRGELPLLLARTARCRPDIDDDHVSTHGFCEDLRLVPFPRARRYQRPRYGLVGKVQMQLMSAELRSNLPLRAKPRIQPPVDGNEKRYRLDDAVGATGGDQPSCMQRPSERPREGDVRVGHNAPRGKEWLGLCRVEPLFVAPVAFVAAVPEEVADPANKSSRRQARRNQQQPERRIHPTGAAHCRKRARKLGWIVRTPGNDESQVVPGDNAIHRPVDAGPAKPSSSCVIQNPDNISNKYVAIFVRRSALGAASLD